MRYLPLLLLMGCATHNSLKPGVERVCTRNICFMFGTAEQVDRQCRKGGGAWDDGKKKEEGDGRRARCCVYLKQGRRIRMWVSREDADCIPHEMAHVEAFFGGYPDEAEGFGVGRDIKRLRRE